jgi:hypothetical protein
MTNGACIDTHNFSRTHLLKAGAGLPESRPRGLSSGTPQGMMYVKVIILQYADTSIQLICTTGH